MIINPLKEKMKSGQVAVGTFINFYAPSVVEIVGYAGLDYIVIDDEHGAFTYPQIEELIRAAEISGTTALVRVSYDDSAIQKALDRGAMGIQVPMVNNKKDAEAVVRKAKYAPIGTRGIAYSVRAAKFGKYKGKEYLDSADENTLVVVHIETQEAVDNFDEIAGVPGVDVVFVGPTDLSVSMGYKEEGANHPKVQAVVKDLLARGKEKGVIMGTLAMGAKDVKRCADDGAGYVITVASGLISEKIKELVDAGKGLKA